MYSSMSLCKWVHPAAITHIRIINESCNNIIYLPLSVLWASVTIYLLLHSYDFLL